MSPPDRNVQAHAWRGALLSGLALILVATGSQAGLIAHFLIGKLVYSTSDAATLFFLGYAALALAWSAVSGPPQTVPRALIGLLVVCLMVGHATNLAASLHYFQGHGLPLDAHVHHWLGSDNSYTSLMHSHLGKPSLALTANALGLASGRYDTGVALGGSLPGGVTALIGGSFLIGLVAALALFPGLMARLDWHPAAVILYLVTSSLCLKTQLDGGPLSYRVPPSALLLFSLLFTTNRERLQHFWRGPGWKLAFVLTAAYLLLWMQLSAERPIPSIGGLLFTLGVYGLLLAWLIGRLRWLLAMPLLLYLGLNIWVDARLNLLPYLERFGSQHRVAVLQADGGITLPNPALLQGVALRDVYARLGEDPLKPRRVLIWRQHETGSHDLESVVQLIDLAGRTGKLIPAEGLKLSDIRLVGPGRLSLRVTAPAQLAPILIHGEGDVLSRANYYVYLHALNGLLFKAGWHEYIMIPATASNPVLD